MRRNLLIISLLAFACMLQAQEQIGLRTENYSGVNGLLLNPASNLSSPLIWDVNIIAADVFFDNNYAYFENTNLLAINKKRDNLNVVVAPRLTGETNIPNDALVFEFFDDNKKRFVNTFVNVMGPSVSVNLLNHSFGVFNNVRFAASTQDIPAPLSYYTYYNRDFFDEFTLDPFQSAVMAWSEIGVNYAYNFETSVGYMGIGANLKYLRGYEATYFENSEAIQFQKLPGDSLTSNQATLLYGLTTSSISEENFSNTVNGTGFGFDLGAVATIDGDDGYLWRLGFSLLDMGSINFNKNAQQHRVQTPETVIVPGAEYNDLGRLEDFQGTLNLFSRQVLGDSTASLQATNFKMGLPSAISLQADYHVMPYVYVNALLVQRLAYQQHSTPRENLLAITPRFEHRWGSFHLPLVLHNYSDFRMGASVRLAYFVIGTDNIGSFIGKRDLTGTDFYVALKFNPFWTSKGGEKGKTKGAKLSNKRVKCYDF